MFSSEKPIFRGAATALITPFRGGVPDLDALRELIHLQLAGKIDALLICGTTGESSALSRKERCSLIRCASEAVRGRVPLIAGAGSNHTEKAILLTKDACEAGADAVLSVTPYYNKASSDGLIRHFTAIADASPKPVLLYNVPSRTGVDLPLPVLRTLARHPNITGIKEASGSMEKIASIAAELCGEGFSLYCGSDELTLPALSVGGAGVFSVLSNLLPEQVSMLCELYFSRQNERAAALSARLFPLIRALFLEVNPIPVKAALAACGRIREEYRLPLCSPSAETRLRLSDAMKDSGFFPEL